MVHDRNLLCICIVKTKWRTHLVFRSTPAQYVMFSAKGSTHVVVYNSTSAVAKIQPTYYGVRHSIASTSRHSAVAIV
jgi:hypothetical protein